MPAKTTNYKSISVHENDHTFYDELRKDFAARKGIPEHMVSIPTILKVAAMFYKQRSANEFRSKKI